MSKRHIKYPCVLSERFFRREAWPRAWKGGWVWVFARGPQGPFEIVCMGGCADQKRYGDACRCRHSILMAMFLKPWYRQRAFYTPSDYENKERVRVRFPEDALADRAVMKMITLEGREKLGLL